MGLLTDLLGDGGNGAYGLLAVTAHNPGSTLTASTGSGSLVDVDATNLAVTFTVPASGKVLVRLAAWSKITSSTTGSEVRWGLREGAADVANSTTPVSKIENTNQRNAASILITGLTPGAVKTWKWAHRTASAAGTAYLYAGGSTGQAVMEVEAVPA